MAIIRARTTIENPEESRPHVVVIGAGASLQAFPNGDANGRRLPLMRDIADMLGIRGRFGAAGLENDCVDDFERAYARLADDDRFSGIVIQIEQTIRDYFASMQLPDEVTLYDRLVLSLREADGIVSFNWDPFLFDAWARNRGIASLPSIWFLHGSVRLASCGRGHSPGPIGSVCTACSEMRTPVPLLYPIAQKDYATNPYIAGSWTEARRALSDALTLTVFGYGAPVSDVEAVNALRDSWFARSDRQAEHVEIIDRPGMDTDVLFEKWRKFVPTLHLQHNEDFGSSWISLWPRRTNQALRRAIAEGTISEQFPLTDITSLAELQARIREIAAYESPQ